MENTQHQSRSAEKTLSIVANVVLWMGIVSSIILFIVALIYLDDYDTRDYGVMLLVVIIPSVLSTLVIWTLLKVFCNISLNLKEINSKIVIDATKYQLDKVVSSPKPTPNAKQQTEEVLIHPQIINAFDNIDDDSLENVILGHILSNEISTARHLLMTKKGMTLNQAIEYIDKLKPE